MLPRVHRLTSGDSFRRVARTGKRSGSRTLVVHLLLAPGSGETALAAPPTVGFVVSRAVGNSVTRNVVKRRLRHLSRERLAGLPEGTEVVVRALPASARASYADLAVDLDKALTKILPKTTT